MALRWLRSLTRWATPMQWMTRSSRIGVTPHTISGWHGAGFMRSGDKIPTEYVTVYTDIETPTPTKFTSVYSFNANPDPDDNDELRSLFLNDANLSMAMSTEFPSTPKTTREFPVDDEGTPNENEGAVMGTFDGAPGTFECINNNGCSIETDDNGALETVNGTTWRFTPDKGAMVNVADGDYLHFGYWLESTENDDGTSSYKFQAFSGGSMAFDGGISNGAAVEYVHGTAEYSGSAGGMYVRKALNPNGSVDAAAEGSFTANARLVAHFGGVDVAISEQYRISGTVSEFMDGDTSLDGWTVKLDEARLVDSGTYSNKFDSTTEGQHGRRCRGVARDVLRSLRHYSRHDRRYRCGRGTERRCRRVQRPLHQRARPWRVRGDEGRRVANRVCRVGQAPSPACCVDLAFRRSLPRLGSGRHFTSQ